MAKQPNRHYKVTLRGTEWDVWLTRENLGLDEYGVCNYDNHTILVEPALKGVERLDTVIHELLHACLPDTAEHSIGETATDLAAALVEIGLVKRT